jgi:hypothetical protein
MRARHTTVTVASRASLRLVALQALMDDLAMARRLMVDNKGMFSRAPKVQLAERRAAARAALQPKVTLTSVQLRRAQQAEQELGAFGAAGCGFHRHAFHICTAIRADAARCPSAAKSMHAHPAPHSSEHLGRH